MGRRYSKNYSNYILKKKYQYTTKGTIWERDWVTIGAKHQIEKGKRPFFGDSGFLFTDNSFPSRQRRHDFGKVVAEWLYDDVKDAKEIVNKVEVNYVSDDLRDFAYYGSCVELVRSSIYNIINWFPGCAWKTNQPVSWVTAKKKIVGGAVEYSVDDNLNGYVISNPFNIDFATDGLKEDEVMNSMRFMSLSYSNYEVVCEHGNDTNAHHILYYTIKRREQSDIETDENYWKSNGVCDYIIQLAKVELACVDEGSTDSFPITLYVLNAYGEIIVVTPGVVGGHTFTELRPVESAIDEYFDNLEGFERLLLRTDTIPLYSNRFLKMFETDNGIRYAYRDYTWPRVNDYCIDIQSPTYVAFVESLIQTSTEFDEMWTDNMWRNMTHESLRNYDWTYTKDFIPGQEQPNVDGGNRLEKLIRIYGGVFDDLKRYIDGIKFTAKVSYDGYNNMPNAELSDRLEYNGWEIFSTIPNFKGQTIDGAEDDSDLSTVYIDYDGLTQSGKRWFYGVNPIDVTAGTNDIDFLRTLSLSSKHIIKSKGTVNGIDMVMALFGIGSDKYDDEENTGVTYKVSERYYTSSLRGFSERVQQNIGDLVHYDSVSSPYDEAYDGVPFGNIELHGAKYIVPYYDSDKYHKGEFTFQSRGGWYKKSLDSLNLNDYEETLSYLNVVPNFESLLSVNTYSLEKVGENANIPPSNIYYVVDPRDYADYNESAPYNITHYFYIMDMYNPQLADSWKPILYEYIDINDTITQEEYDNLPYHFTRTDLDWGEYSPGDITTEQDYAALDAYYLFICNNTVVNRIEKNTYGDNENLGHVVTELCEVKDNTFRISKSARNDNHEYWGLTEDEFNDIIVTPGKFIPSTFVHFAKEGSEIDYNEWSILSSSKKAEYEFDYQQISEALGAKRSTEFNALVDGEQCDFNLELLFYVSHPLTQGDYVHLIDLCTNERDNYVKIGDGGRYVYVKKYEGDTELYERAKYLDNIISSNIGNNPHVGFGRYDLGREYREYMEYPFKYYEDNYVLPQEQSEIRYAIRYKVYFENGGDLGGYESIDEATYNNKPYTKKRYIKFTRTSETVNMLNVSHSGNKVMFTLRFDKNLGSVKSNIYNWEMSLIKRAPQRVSTRFDVIESQKYTEVLVEVEDPDGNAVEEILTAINNGITISYDDYMELPAAQRKNYELNGDVLLDALKDENRSDELDTTHEFDLRLLYIKSNHVFSDFKYDINEYETTGDITQISGKIKNISDTYHYEDGYTTRISQDDYDALSDEEKAEYERQIVEVDESGNPVCEYVKSITVDEYNELSGGEKEGYYKTTAKIIRRGLYRDLEDFPTITDDDSEGGDTPIDYVEDDYQNQHSYYLNSKLITLELKNTNERFKKFFLDVIGKYVMQVMPSTAITVVLFDCDNKTEETEGGDD